MNLQSVASQGRLGATESVVMTSDLAALSLPSCLACCVVRSGVFVYRHSSSTDELLFAVPFFHATPFVHLLNKQVGCFPAVGLCFVFS